MGDLKTLDELHAEDGVAVDPNTKEADTVAGKADIANGHSDSTDGSSTADIKNVSEPTDAEGADDNQEGKKPDEDIDTKDVKLSGIEQYLSQFDIEGGMIQFDDGTMTPFSELDPNKQAEILTNLHNSNVKSIEEKYGLDENEVGLINYLRTNDLKIEDYIESLAQERVKTALAAQEINSENYDSMSADSVYLKFLKDSNPDATTEELENDLEKAKELKSYEKSVEALRNNYKQEQNLNLQKSQDTEEKEFAVLLDNQREEVVNTAANINSISGITLNKDAKNSLLDQILNVNDSGDSVFMEEVFSDPEKVINAAFWYYYGPEIMKQKETFWKAEKSKAYKLGRESALGKAPNSLNFVDKKNIEKSSAGGDDYITLDELNS